MGESLYEVFSLQWWLSQGVIAEDTGILSSLNLPGVHLAIMYLAPLIHEGQALRVTGARGRGGEALARGHELQLPGMDKYASVCI